MACGDSVSGDSSAVEVADSAGVIFVHNLSGPPDTLELTAPEVRIGHAEGRLEYLFQEVRDVQPLADGTIVVADLGGRVALFDGSGRWLKDLGARGRGPGELQQPVSAWALKDTVTIWDVGLRRFSHFATDGEFLGSRRIDKRDLARPIRPFHGGYLDGQESGQLMDPRPARGASTRTASSESAAMFRCCPGWV